MTHLSDAEQHLERLDVQVLSKTGGNLFLGETIQLIQTRAMISIAQSLETIATSLGKGERS